MFRAGLTPGGLRIVSGRVNPSSSLGMALGFGDELVFVLQGRKALEGKRHDPIEAPFTALS